MLIPGLASFGACNSLRGRQIHRVLGASRVILLRIKQVSQSDNNSRNLKRDLDALQIVKDEEADPCLRLSASLQIQNPDIRQEALGVLQHQPNISLQIASIESLNTGLQGDTALYKIIYKDSIPISYRIDAAKRLYNAFEREKILISFLENHRLHTKDRLKAASYLMISQDLEAVVRDLLAQNAISSRLELSILQNIQNENLKYELALSLIKKLLAFLLEAHSENPENTLVEDHHKLVLDCIGLCRSCCKIQQQAALLLCKHTELDKKFLEQVAGFIQDDGLKQEVLQAIALGLKPVQGGKTKSAAKVYRSVA